MVDTHGCHTGTLDQKNLRFPCPTRLVVHVHALHAPPVPLNDVDEVVHVAVLLEENLAVVDLVLLQHTQHRALLHLREMRRVRV